MIAILRIRVLKQKLETMAHTFTYGADDTHYVTELPADYVREQVAKHQLALSAALDFDLDEPDVSLEALEKVWFATAPIFSAALTEFKDFLQKHREQVAADK